MTYESDIALKDMVYLTTDPEQWERIVIAIEFAASGSIAYKVMLGTQESWHSRCELSKGINEAKRLGFEKKEA
jgi:hypothetical protein